MLMLVTEEEAKKKWCPFSRAVRSSQGAMAGVNRDGPRADPRAVCLASECMAWRRFPQGENYSENLSTGERTYLEPVGFCGLAGKL